MSMPSRFVYVPMVSAVLFFPLIYWRGKVFLILTGCVATMAVAVN